MSAAETWDTGEAITVLGNDEPLYLYAAHMGTRGYNAAAFRTAFANVVQAHEVDPSEVDWAAVAAHFALDE